MKENKKKAIIFSGPSGGGKTTIVNYLIKNNPSLMFSVSATTRNKRFNEIHGKDYYFLTPEVFRRKIENREFIEYEQVYEGLYYGTLKSEVCRIWKNDKYFITDIDVKGALALIHFFKQKILSIFVKTSREDILETRLKYRNTESEISLKERMEKSQYELSFEKSFDEIIVNNTLSESFKVAQELVYKYLS